MNIEAHWATVKHPSASAAAREQQFGPVAAIFESPRAGNSKEWGGGDRRVTRTPPRPGSAPDESRHCHQQPAGATANLLAVRLPATPFRHDLTTVTKRRHLKFSAPCALKGQNMSAQGKAERVPRARPPPWVPVRPFPRPSNNRCHRLCIAEAETHPGQHFGCRSYWMRMKINPIIVGRGIRTSTSMQQFNLRWIRAGR